MAQRASLALVILLLAATLAGCGRAVIPAASRSSRNGVAPVDVRFKSGDGTPLAGRLFGRGSVAVILAHMYPTDQRSWEAFARQLAAKGFTVLTFDFRGYGRSGGARMIPFIDRDVAAAVRLVRARGSEKVFVVGASMGGTAALKRAAPDRVDGVATLSAPAEFLGLSAAEEIRRITVPKLFMASSGDGSAAAVARRMYARAAEPKELKIFEGSEHGTAILSGNAGPEAVAHIVDFLARNSR